jgi:hypothetical protein
MMRIIAFLAVLLSGNAAFSQTTTPILPTVSSTAIEGSHTFCTAQCKLWTLTVTSGSVAGFVLVFNLSTDPADGSLSPPTPGAPATTPAYCYPWPANYSGSISFPGTQFTNGLTVSYSTGANCVTKTESSTAFFAAQVQ